MKAKTAILAIIAAAVSLAAHSQDRVRFRATGLTCAMCSKAIHSAVKVDPSARKVDPNLQTQEWHVTYDKGKFDKDRLIGQVESAGFGVSDIWVNDSLVYRRSTPRKGKPAKR